MKHIYLIGIFALMSLASYAQVTTSVFGSNKTLDGVVQPHHSHTTNKWIKLAELTLNGNYNAAGITVDFFPRNPNHGDSRQQLNVQFRNNHGTAIENSHDISLVTFHGQQKTLRDVKVVHTSASYNEVSGPSAGSGSSRSGSSSSERGTVPPGVRL